jgi:hypothetical protein
MARCIKQLRWLLLIIICGAWPAAVHADAPVGQFDLQFSPVQGVWDATGNYQNNEFDTTNNIDLIQDDKGKITGIGAATATDSGITVNLVYNFAGAVKTVSDVTRVTLIMKVSGTATDGIVTVPVRGSIKLTLDLDKVNNILVGAGAGNVCVQGRCVRVGGPVQFDIPQPMDGSWTLALDLQSPDNKKIVGTATATLSNGRVIPFTASGRYAATSALAKLNLRGTGGTVTLQNDAIQWVLSKAKALGQTVPTSP